jgi:hypothetical protein
MNSSIQMITGRAMALPTPVYFDRIGQVFRRQRK